MRRVPVIGLVLAIIGAGCGTPAVDPESTEEPAAEDPRIAALYVESCLLCHGNRELQRGPVLNGLAEWYVDGQLRKFKDGVRGGNPDNRSEHLMAAAVSLYSTNQIPALARHIAGLEPAEYVHTVRGNPVAGARVYAERCAACHGAAGEGRRDLQSPPLLIQEDWYLLDQLVRFRMGLRGSHPRDLSGDLMRQATTNLNTGELRDVVNYIANELQQPRGDDAVESEPSRGNVK